MLKGKDMTPTKNYPVSGACCRQSAKGVVETMFKRKQADLEALNTLLAAVPWDKLTEKEDEAIWRFLVSGNW